MILPGQVLEKGFQLGVDDFNGIDQVIAQAASRRADLLAALGELVAFESGSFVSELFDDRLITMNLSALGVDLGHQLRCQSAQLYSVLQLD